jgi:hypothetical protein
VGVCVKVALQGGCPGGLLRLPLGRGCRWRPEEHVCTLAGDQGVQLGVEIHEGDAVLEEVTCPELLALLGRQTVMASRLGGSVPRSLTSSDGLRIQRASPRRACPISASRRQPRDVILDGVQRDDGRFAARCTVVASSAVRRRVAGRPEGAGGLDPPPVAPSVLVIMIRSSVHYASVNRV